MKKSRLLLSAIVLSAALALQGCDPGYENGDPPSDPQPCGLDICFNPINLDEAKLRADLATFFAGKGCITNPPNIDIEKYVKEAMDAFREALDAAWNATPNKLTYEGGAKCYTEVNLTTLKTNIMAGAMEEAAKLTIAPCTCVEQVNPCDPTEVGAQLFNECIKKMTDARGALSTDTGCGLDVNLASVLSAFDAALPSNPPNHTINNLDGSVKETLGPCYTETQVDIAKNAANDKKNELAYGLCQGRHDNARAGLIAATNSYLTLEGITDAGQRAQVLNATMAEFDKLAVGTPNGHGIGRNCITQPTIDAAIDAAEVVRNAIRATLPRTQWCGLPDCNERDLLRWEDNLEDKYQLFCQHIAGCGWDEFDLTNPFGHVRQTRSAFFARALEAHDGVMNANSPHIPCFTEDHLRAGEDAALARKRELHPDIANYRWCFDNNGWVLE